MKKQTLLLLFTMCLSFGLNAQLFCPENVTVSCLSDLTTDECGIATVVSGNYHPSMVKYVDDDQTNACNEGIVFRRFYLDVDYSNTYTENEPSCIQTITLTYNSLPLNIQFPIDKQYTCLDEVPVDSPTWSYHPCDLVGYTYDDEIFEFEEGACLKIVRTYEVINWCIYDVNPAEGLTTGIQIIKIVDDLAPEISACDDQYFDTDSNCEATVTLTNSATDLGDCPSGSLTWRVSVDLWGDGTEDLVYGPNEPAPFRLDPVQNGEEVSVAIPEALSISKHKVVWKVTDGCGNVRSCSNEFFVEDNKPPTPYCLSFTSAALNGAEDGEIVIPATFFNVDKVDNCSKKQDITLSFSENIDDTEKVIKCGDTGFQFFRIYHTDEAGNQDFCEVFMLIFDNGTCFGKFEPQGDVTRPNGSYIIGAAAYLMHGDHIISQVESDDTGFFSFGSQDLMEDYNAVVKKEDEDMTDVDIEDFVLMRSALLGLENLNFYQRVAADVNLDGSFDIDDLYAFRDVLLGKAEIAKEDIWSFIPKMHNYGNSHTNLNVSNSIPYTSYESGFSYYGVKKGDLTGASYEIEDNPESEDVIELILELGLDRISIISKENIETDAFQFDFNYDGLHSDAYELNEEGKRYTDLSISKSFFSKDVLFSAECSNKDMPISKDLIKKAKVFRKGASIPSQIKWTIIDQREIKNEFFDRYEINVYPQPIGNSLTVEADGISNLVMYNLIGEKIDIQLNVQKDFAQVMIAQNLPRGIYFLKLIICGEERIVKLVK